MKREILIVDDEKAIRFTVKEFLLKEGYEVYSAENFNEAVKIITTEHLDTVLSDIVLEGKTGVDILKEVKERRLNCPVILFTGYPDVGTASEAVRHGAYDYITKPIKKEALLRTISNALQYKTLVEERNRVRANLEAIFKSVKDAIITVDKDFKVIEVNEAAKAICGFTREEAIGKTFDSLPEICCRHCIDTIKRTIIEKRPIEIYRIECKHKIRNGQVVSLNTFPLMDKQSRLSGCVMIVKDETRTHELERELKVRQRFFNIVGKDDKIQTLYSLIEHLKDIDTTVLITGETGTGKELIVEALHYSGVRSQGPLVKVNCSALPETLLESELFGHVKGAFTSAVTDKVGRFKQADGGTIFLDEIGDVSLNVQQRLLRVLQEKEFERVGESKPTKVDVRIVAATNQDLKEKVRLREFRNDLYYRLKVVVLSPPPLRDRRKDIPLLVEHFIKKFNQKLKKHIEDISQEVYKIFMEYEWPGNVRELENTLEHSFVLCHERIITIDELPVELRETKTTSSVNAKSNESETILQALERNHWNKSLAASFLGVSRRTIYNKIKEYNLQPK
ncbi:MAG: response regulator [Candidatus Scalindua sp. AMX11]|nr:MAG: response regulator [Candidatus Scalindua sp.]NOG83071.1 sigma 54-interacting transcriptional regulator [Planctomycetota bacterium]RZV79533.1 MAG: response regulator [Candidatus Scalindua sp. SCAELEC01]TDE65169.1 MAG: response regulator [Candidatus Scalindua sp. AMX11]GJQ58595.1 MAG: sigma-54-dependent Fis family transcriptional regulator [Candidatus Scalindua sp.]